MGKTLHLVLNWLHAGSAWRGKSERGDLHLRCCKGAQVMWGFNCREDLWLLRDEAALAAFMWNIGEEDRKRR